MALTKTEEFHRIPIDYLPAEIGKVSDTVERERGDEFETDRHPQEVPPLDPSDFTEE